MLPEHALINYLTYIVEQYSVYTSFVNEMKERYCVEMNNKDFKFQNKVA